MVQFLMDSATLTKPSNVVFDDLLIFYYQDEEGYHIYHAPALNVVGAGDDEAEAKDSFQLTLQEFVEFTLDKGTFISELEKYGWTIEKREKEKILKASQPSWDSIVSLNSTKEIFSLPDVKLRNQAFKFS